ncbi:TetR family transcriptional regulator [Rhodobacter maris]|uniref:TetR family transcriptional regulator n=2 Tax=Rhodobacter maris TaxID=446682 RepID=A0A285S9W9_9RHOB|nr:TetR family transcriptional regulator [Rhodobacter maris]
MRQIAAAVGVQAGALYLYTPDKEALLFDLLKTHMEELLVAWAEEPRGDGALGTLESFVRFHIRYNLMRAEAVFLSYMELRNLNAANFAVIEALRGRYEAELETILKAGQAEGSLVLPDTKLATMAIIAMLTGVTTWYREGGRLGRETVETIYWDMVRKAVAA